MEGYLLWRSRGVGSDAEGGSAGLEGGVGLASARCAGGDDAQHLLLHHTWIGRKAGVNKMFIAVGIHRGPMILL